MLNWKTILGGLLIFGSTSEFFSVWSDYKSGKLEFWPTGVEVGFILILLLGGWLIKSGLKGKKI